MTRPNFLSCIVFAVLVTLGCVPLASAHYSPDLGRWISRDPVGVTPDTVLRTIRVGERHIMEPAMPRGGLGRIRPTEQYADGMNLYQYVGGRPLTHIDPDGLKKYTYKEIADIIGGCSYALPANATDWRVKQRGLISNEAMLCLFWKESSFDTEAKSPQGYYGLGQMGQAACDDVDRAYNLPPGTCWRRQQSNDLCHQIANSIAYLHHVLTNPRDFEHDGTLRGGLRKYGPIDAGFEEYADPILRCADCLKNSQLRDDKGNPRGVESCPGGKAQDCFDKMNEEVRRAREQRRR